MNAFTSPFFLQYLVSGILSLLVSGYVLTRKPRTLPLKLFFLYGFVVAIWEFSVFCQRAAPNRNISALFFVALSVSSSLSLAMYLATILSIRQTRRLLPLVFVPAIVSGIALIFRTFEVFQTEFGWSYRIAGNTIPHFITVAVFLAYLLAIILTLFTLTRKARSHSLKRKYAILLASFVIFQAIGIPLTNYIIISNPSFPPLGGLLNLLTFLFIGSALLIKEERILVPRKFEVEDFSDVYSSFLAVLYNLTSGTRLGEESFKFTRFVERSLIGDQVRMAKGKIIFEKPSSFDVARLIRRNLEILKEEFKGNVVVDYYLRVLKAAYHILGDKFDAIVKEYEGFLKESDLIYGVGKGCYLEKISKDKSLDSFDAVDACLKLYKRLLLLVTDEIQSLPDFKKRLMMYYATGNVKITEYGEILMHDVREKTRDLPEEERLSILIESFNSFVSWVYEKILFRRDADVQTILNRLHRILLLNKKRAIDLNIYHSFLEQLAAKIPETHVQRMYSELLEELVETRTSELREAQKRLLYAERMAAIGETAAMVGHDLRNPLQVILNALYLADIKLESLPVPPDQKEPLAKTCETVREQAAYMNKIVSDLQDYARPLSPELTETDLRELIDNVLSVTTVPQNIKTSVIIDKKFPRVYVDPVLMRRVLSNLVTNALQAMPNGGELTISAHNDENFAFITVSDTGVGIPKENLSKLFTPLFTTKAKGQGFGLAVCKRLVEAHGGQITVESESGKGSTFTIKIPLGHENLQD